MVSDEGSAESAHGTTTPRVSIRADRILHRLRRGVIDGLGISPILAADL